MRTRPATNSIPLTAALLVAALCLARCASALADATPPLPQWVWTDASTAPGQSVAFSRSFDLPQAPPEARLQLAADYCHTRVTINGHVVLNMENFSPITALDVAHTLRAGSNEVVIAASASAGPSAVALSLDAALADGDRLRIGTDGDWTVSSDPGQRVAALGAVAPELWGEDARSIEISPFDNYEQWRLAGGAESGQPGGRFWTVPHFEIELVRAAGPEEGSWVSLAFDPEGRITVAREDQGLLRFTLDRPGGGISQVETINETLLECRGLAYVGNDLYVNANNSRGTYRLRDADGDGSLETEELVREFTGGVGHGRNQLKPGPDDRVYSICGDSVDLPTGVHDRTSPFREARRGPAPQEGFVAAYNPADGNWELVCAGMRNPFGIAFHRDGEAFAYDADAEFDMGTPWYRPTRILHLTSGADFGWRSVTGMWPPYDPDQPEFAPAVLDIGKGSPTAVEFGYRSYFPPRYRNALYVLDWAYGRVLAVHLAPRGAGYVAQAETFLQGQPLNVCCLDFGPDGAMYLVTGGRKTRSGLYRVRYTGEDKPSGDESRHAQQRDEFSRAARQVRRQLEAWHGRVDPAAVDAVWESLDSADPQLRYAARTALEHQPLQEWRERALAETRPAAALTLLLALARAGDASLAQPVLHRAAQMDFAHLTLSQKRSLLRVVDLCVLQQPDLIEQWRTKLLARFDPALSGTPGDTRSIGPCGDGARLDRELARMLLLLGAPRIVERLSARLADARTQEDRMHYLFLLRDVADGWTAETHRVYFAALRDTDQYRGGEGMPGFLRTIRETALARLADADRAALGPLLEPAAAEESLPAAVREFVHKWTLADLSDLVDAAPAGDPRRGATLFQEALCARCHRVGATGPAVGPDLTYVARRFSRGDILRAILVPSQVVAENYRNVEVVTTGGRVVIGRPVTSGDYRSQTLRIATDPLRPATVVEIDKREIEQHRMAASSPMPDGLLDRFTREEVRDLLAYLQAGFADQPRTRPALQVSPDLERKHDGKP